MTVSVSPAATTLAAGQTQQFTATVHNTSNTSVTWSASPNVGSISAGGLYTPPAAIGSLATVTITAASGAGNTETGAALVNLVPWSNGYANRATIAVGGAVVPSTQTNFPMLICGLYPYLATVFNGGYAQNTTTLNGNTAPADLIFTSDALGLGTTLLNWEIGSYTAATGEIEAWVRIPSLSNGTVIYMFYGNSQVTAYQGNATAVWGANYQGVWHLGSGAVLSTADSSSNSKNGTPYNSPTAAPGQIGAAVQFNAASDQDIDLGSSGAGGSLDFPTGPFTVSL